MLVCVTGRPPDVGIRRRRQAFSDLAVAAKELGMSLMVVTPLSTGLLRNGVHGWEPEEFFDTIVWKRAFHRRLQRPVVYDAMYLADLKSYRAQYRQLLGACHAQHVPVFNPVLPAKDVVFREIEQSSSTRSQFPKTEYQVTASQVIRMLNQNPRICLKPVYGSGGRNIIFVHHLDGGRYRVHSERFFGRRVNQVTDKAGLRELIHAARRQRIYMAQEYIQLLETRDSRKLDFRYTVQRNETGQWAVTAITARYGAPGSTLTNYHAGGQIQSLTRLTSENSHLLGQVGVSPEDLDRAQGLSIGVAKCLEKSFPMLAALGIDIGQAEDRRQFVYDCNGRPGRDILTDEEVQTYMRNIVGFARHIQDTYYRK